MTYLLPIVPILLPLLGAMIALLLRRRQTAQAGWSFAVLLASFAASAWLLVTVWQSGEPLVYQSGGWPAPFGISIVADMLSALFVFMTQLIAAAGILYALGSKDKVTHYPSFYPLFLALTAALTGAYLTGDLFNLYVFAELLVISGTVLVAISDDYFGVEAAYKYFYISLIASFFMLLSIGSIYAAYGTLNMADLALRIQEGGAAEPLLWPAIAFLLAAFMIKSAVFPFHFWQPDLYTAAPTAVGAVLSSVVSKLGIYGFLRMTTLLFVDEAPQIQSILLVLGVVGVIFGGLAAIGTHNVKRMFAYSSLAQIGFILVGIGWGTPLAIMAAVIFAFNHSVIKAAMIMLAGYVASFNAGKSAAFEVVTGAGKALPAAGLLFFAGSLALAGIPPTNGFVSKMTLFSSGLDAQRFWSLLLIGVASIFTLVYTMRAFQRIWWQTPIGIRNSKLGRGALGVVRNKASDADTNSPGSGDQLLAPAVLVLLIVVLGIWAEPLVAAAELTAAWLGDPAIYISAVLGG